MEWKSVRGFEGYYEVNELGELRSLDRIVECANGSKQRRKGKLLKFNIDRGYKKITLTKGCKGYNLFVHRIVFEAFVALIPSNYVINHIDGDKSNPCLDNLEMITRSANTQHAHDNNLVDMSSIKKRVKQLTVYGELVKIHESAAEASRDVNNGKVVGTIAACCRGEIKTSMGYRWEYA